MDVQKKAICEMNFDPNVSVLNENNKDRLKGFCCGAKPIDGKSGFYRQHGAHGLRCEMD
jgi:hypothetical protein